MSPLGIKVADLLGYLFYGIYHLDSKALTRVEWDSETNIEINLRCHELATFDGDEMTRLVFLAHQFCLRCSVEAATINVLRLRFHPRERSGGMWKRHPTLSEAVAAFNERFPLGELAPIPIEEEVVA